MNYYNENDKYTAQWLRNLIHAQLIPNGHVDDRSITEVEPSDLDGYTQCHFFAGIAGWSYALQLAGWPEDREIWTGSCPCQPFSVAGAGAGTDDPRHLWPDFFRLIRAKRPAVLMGEQVFAAVRQGWLDSVFDDLEAEGYACGAVGVPACAINAPHRRDRLWFVAHADSQGRPRLESSVCVSEAGQRNWRGKEDLQRLYSDPYGRAHWPEPLVRRMDDGIPRRLEHLHGFGNAIHPGVAAEVIAAYMETQ
jgi:DNA (cytosine-5)-methyltransferase 1